jgi:transportin-3
MVCVLFLLRLYPGSYGHVTVMEDYLRMSQQLLEHAPDILFPSPAFPVTFRATMGALTLIQSDIVFIALDFIRDVITHDSMELPAVPPPNAPMYAAAIKSVVEKEGLVLTGLLLTGLVGDFPSDSTSSVITIFRMIAKFWPSQLLAWLPPVLQQMPSATTPDQVKQAFLQEVTQ